MWTKNLSAVGRANYLRGRMQQYRHIISKQRRIEVADFHDIIALALYGEEFVNICAFIRMKIALEAQTPVF